MPNTLFPIEVCVGVGVGGTESEAPNSKPEFMPIRSPCLTSVVIHSQLGESLDIPLHSLRLLAGFQPNGL